MDDLISRQAAIDVASHECYELRGVFGRIEKGLNALPSAQSEYNFLSGLTAEGQYNKIKWLIDYGMKYTDSRLAIIEWLEENSAQPEPQWIPVKMRPMDSEERKYWEDQFGEELADEDAVMFDCPMPEDGQEILVSYRKWISMDKCEIDGGCYGCEGNGDWRDIIAWMPLPECYKGEKHETK